MEYLSLFIKAELGHGDTIEEENFMQHMLLRLSYDRDCRSVD